MDVALAPSLLPAAPEARRRAVYVVVDLIRASTTLCVLLERGCRRVHIADGIASARRAAARMVADREPARRALLIGEVEGIAPPGFDYGNSPAELAPLDLSTAEPIFATTNGTRAMHACVGGAAILVGALRNARTVAHAAVSHVEAVLASDLQATGTGHAQPPPAVTVVCAGIGALPAYDDAVCAGVIADYVVQELTERQYPVAVGEGARIALAARESALRGGLRVTLAESTAARGIAALGLSADLDWCVALDVSAVVPAVVGATPAEDLLLVAPLVSTQP
ncbi:MAG TPA: 2-phosphosulfolactate phosphatase [Ktedonobacterales bacterium]